MNIRCSQLDAAFSCPASVLAKGLRVNPLNPMAEIGKQVHERAASLIMDGEFNQQWEDLDEDEAGLANSMMEYVELAWRDLMKYFPATKVEAVVQAVIKDQHTTEEHILDGTIDLLSPVGDANAVFADFKTGIIDNGYHHQMAGYAMALWDSMGRPEGSVITGIVVFLRHRYYRVVRYDKQKLEAWEHDLTHNVLAKPDEYRPGKQCAHCSLYSTCPARKAMVEATLDAMLFGGTAGPGSAYAAWLEEAKTLIAGLTTENKNEAVVGEAIAKMMTRLKMAEQAVGEAKELIREAVDRVGPIKISEDHALALREQNRRSLDPIRAMPVLRAKLSDKDICDSMSLSLPKLTTAFISGKPHGQRGAARGMLERALNDAGAINVTIQRRLEEVALSSVEEQPNGPISEHTRSSPETPGAGPGPGAGSGKRKRK